MGLVSGIQDPGSGINPFRIRDPGSRGQKGTGSRIRIRNTDFFIHLRHYSVICKQLLFSNNRDRVRWTVLGLWQDEGWTDLFQNFSVNSLKWDLSNNTTVNPPFFHWSIVYTFKVLRYFLILTSISSNIRIRTRMCEKLDFPKITAPKMLFTPSLFFWKSVLKNTVVRYVFKLKKKFSSNRYCQSLDGIWLASKI